MSWDLSCAFISAVEPAERRLRTGDIELCVFEWGSPADDKPSRLLAHATGFHARCWDEILRRAGGVHAFAVDQRGHGRSTGSAVDDWTPFGEDLADLAANLGGGPFFGVGHSMGGYALTAAAALRPGQFERLLLIDPVIGEPGDYGHGDPWPGDEDHPTARRRARFDSVEEMIDRFRDRPPYANFAPEVLADYCRFGLLPEPDGDGFTLACPPPVEASIYRTARARAGIHEAAGTLTLPVEIVRMKEPAADRHAMDFSSSPTWPGLATLFPRARELHLPDRTHFLPMESPQTVADWLVAGSCFG